MELQGKVIAALEPRSGTSARGEWTAQDFVIETNENFPHKMVFSVFGADRLQRFGIQVGQNVNVSFDIDAHEYNGRWFNSIRAFDVRQVSSESAPAPVTTPVPDAPATDPFTAAANGESADDLPF